MFVIKQTHKGYRGYKNMIESIKSVKLNKNVVYCNRL